MTTNVKYVTTQDNITNAAKVMENLNVGVVPVCEGERPIGMITDRDIVLRNVAKGTDYNNTSVGDIMSNGVIYGTPGMDVHEAASLMAENQIRRLPVVEDGKIVGIVSIGDLSLQDKLIDNAGEALSNISQPSQPNMY